MVAPNDCWSNMESDLRYLWGLKKKGNSKKLYGAGYYTYAVNTSRIFSAHCLFARYGQ